MSNPGEPQQKEKEHFPTNWYCCPICGERFTVPLDALPRSQQECDWLWRNVVFGLVRERLVECRYSELMRHGD